MLSAYIVRMVEGHADTLTKELVDDLLTNARTPSLHRLSPDAIRRGAYEVYRHLGDWLANGGDENVERTFEAMGRRRFQQQVPLDELVYAVVLTKQHLRQRLRSVRAVSSSVEIHNEIELDMLIGRFFDKVLYAGVRGYESARSEAARPARTRAKMTLDQARTKLDWVP
jgi:hypothetical protein